MTVNSDGKARVEARIQAYNVQPGAVEEGGGVRNEIWQFTAVYVAPNDTENPNAEWSKATPSASLIMYVSNPGAMGKIQNGKLFRMILEEL